MVEGRRGTHREQYSSDQKDKILSAAARVFTEKGYQRATTKAIAKAAGLSEGALYYHFDNKKDLLVGVLDQLVSGAEQGVDPEMTADVEFRTLYTGIVQRRMEKVNPSVPTLFALISDVLTNRELAQYMYKTKFLPVFEKAELLIETYIKKGEVRNVDIPLTARLISFVLGLGIDFLYLMGDEPIKAELNKNGGKLTELISTVFLDGISLKKQ